MNRTLLNCWKQITASILVIAMLATSVSLEVFATEATENKNVETASEKESTKSDYQISKNDIIKSELTEDSTTYDAGNGLKVTELYSQNVRFKDDKGNLVDYDPSLVKVEGKKTDNGTSLEKYAYENKTGDKKQYFPKEMTEETPILM